MTKELTLIKYIENQMNFTFKLGKNDCILFVAGAIDAMQGTNLRAKYAGLWTTQKDVNEYTSNNKSVSEALKELGYKSVELNYIQTGDIIIIEQAENNFRTYGVFTGSKAAVFTEKGLLLFPINSLEKIKKVLRCPQ